MFDKPTPATCAPARHSERQRRILVCVDSDSCQIQATRHQLQANNAPEATAYPPNSTWQILPAANRILLMMKENSLLHHTGPPTFSSFPKSYEFFTAKDRTIHRQVLLTSLVQHGTKSLTYISQLWAYLSQQKHVNQEEIIK